jgi:hypothetical protein
LRNLYRTGQNLAQEKDLLTNNVESCYPAPGCGYATSIAFFIDTLLICNVSQQALSINHNAAIYLIIAMDYKHASTKPINNIYI